MRVGILLLYICKRFGDIEEYRTIVAMLRLTVARRGVLHISRRASRICSSSIATLNARGSIGRSIKNMQTTCRRATRQGVVQGPAVEGGLPHLLPTNAIQIITCVSLPPATISSVPIYDFAEANEELVDEHMWKYIIHVAERAFV